MQIFWNAGCQLVALNYQTLGELNFLFSPRPWSQANNKNIIENVFQFFCVDFGLYKRLTSLT